MKKRKKGCLLLLVLMLVAVAIIAWLQTPDRELQIARDTTFYTEPLLDDGRVDYLTIMNRIYSDGVNNENNALIPLLEVLDFSGTVSPEYVDRLRRYLALGKVDIKFNLKGHAQLLNKLFPIDPADEEAFQKRENDVFAVEHPWKTADYPQLAEVLRELSPALDIVVEASRRPRYFAPLMVGENTDQEKMLLAVLLPVSQEIRAFANSLSFRAMSRLGENDVEGAIEDIKAIRRLARLIDQSPILVDGLISIAIDKIAFDAEAFLIQAPGITDDQLRQYQDFLEEPQPFSISFPVRIGRYDRCMALDALSHLNEYGFGSTRLNSSEIDSQIFLALMADPNEAMRQVNRFFDSTVKMFAIPDIRKRLAEVGNWYDSLEEMEVEFNSIRQLAKSIFQGPSGRGRLFGDLALSVLAPAVYPLYECEVRAELSDRLMHLAISIELYKRNIGQYPEALADLQPEYISEIPQDWFSTGPVSYRRTESGFVVYSIGQNRIDDGGLDNEDNPAIGHGDIRVRIGEYVK